MSDGLIVPQRIEYIIARPPRRRLRLAAVLALLLIAALAGAFFMVLHARKPRKYPTLQFPLAGLKADLKTKWIDGSGHYIFEVRPSPGNEARFVSVVQSVPRDQLYFDIHLLDSDAFEVCSTIPQMHVLQGPDGKPSGMRADATVANCNQEQLRSASRWHVTYRFPPLSASISPTAKAQ